MDSWPSRMASSWGSISVRAASAAPATNRYASARALVRSSNNSGSSVNSGLESSTARREAGQRLVTFDDASFDRILVAAVVDQIPGLVGDVARGLRRGLLPQHVDELQLERLELLHRVARGHARQRGDRRLSP